MTGDPSGYAIDIDRLPGSENASRFDDHEHGASVSFFVSFFISRNMTNGEKDRSIGILHKQFLITR